MRNSATGRLLRTCYHESGHGLVAVVLAVPVGAVTVRPCANFRGCALTYHQIDLTDVDPYLHLSPRAWPPHVRSSIENWIMIKLAGPIAAAMGPAPGESVGDPFAGEQHALPDHPWPGPTGLTPAEQHDLAIEAAAPAAPSDAELAAEMAWDAFGGRERAAWRHSRLLADEARLLLEQHADALERLARALLKHRTLGGADVGTHTNARPRLNQKRG